ncbi:MAG: hypothetical protein ACLGIN_00750, partial [Candidatus Sericytochromatia bacterium]
MPRRSLESVRSFLPPAGAALVASSLLLSACTIQLWGPGVSPGGSSSSGGNGGTAKVGLAEKSFQLNGATESAAV